jgi:hypothetical protein
MKYTLVERKPAVYDVEFDGRSGRVSKTGDNTRSKRWHLIADGEDRYFRSRREAFHFFKTGEKFKTKPVYASLGGRGGTRRIR